MDTYMPAMKEQLDSPSLLLTPSYSQLGLVDKKNAAMHLALEREREFLYGPARLDEQILSRYHDMPQCPICTGPWALDLDACIMCGTTSQEVALSTGQYITYNDMNKAATPEVSFGRLVRIPRHDSDGNVRGHRDVTVKDAKRIAKRLRKASRQIEKAVG